MTTPKIERRVSTVHLIPESVAPLRCGDVVPSRRARVAALKRPKLSLWMEFKCLEGTLSPNQLTPIQFFVAQLFVAHVVSLEVFLQETVALETRMNPEKVSLATFALSELLDAGGREALIQRAAEQVLYPFMFKKSLDYLNSLCDFLSIDPDRVSPSWAIFIEAKARRDLVLHNAWRCNQACLRRLEEASLCEFVEVGDSMDPTDKKYLDKISHSLIWLATAVTKLVLRKYWPYLAAVFSEMLGYGA
jgi:hypothetical protein